MLSIAILKDFRVVSKKKNKQSSHQDDEETGSSGGSGSMDMKSVESPMTMDPVYPFVLN